MRFSMLIYFLFNRDYVTLLLVPTIIPRSLIAVYIGKASYRN